MFKSFVKDFEFPLLIFVLDKLLTAVSLTKLDLVLPWEQMKCLSAAKR